MLRLFNLGIVGAVSLGSFSVLAEEGKTMEGKQVARNFQDLSGKGTLNESQLDGSKTDERITRQIRQELVRREDFSETAKNIKIVTLGGVVNLKGLVKKESESKQIEAIAARTVGDRKKVVNELAVE